MSGEGAARLPVVGVMGSGEHAHAELAEPLGRSLARLGVHLLTGGGGGVMASAARGFCSVDDRAGLSLGILPASRDAEGRAPEGYPNPWIELAVRTHLAARGAEGGAADSRNHLNVLTADVVVALPGGAGTRSEVELALRYRRPVIAYHPPDADRASLVDGVPVAADLDGVLDFVRRVLAGESAAP